MTAALLVVDDDPLTRKLLQKFLTQQGGYRVETVGDPATALGRLQAQAWDLVLLDWLLPGMTGLELLRRIRQSYPPGVLPVIMVTGRGSSNDVITALRAGANDYITKPLNLPVVAARVAAQLATVRSIRAQRSLNPSLLGGRYEILRPLGQGGFSRTYLAQDWHRPGQPLCVVKKLLSVPPGDPQKLERIRQLFHWEAQVLERLGHYKRIPRLLAYFEQEGNFYLVEEFIAGPTLRERFADGQPRSFACSKTC
ncbi:MAG: response regulator [Gloeomargarita sp. GMQP_bins_5]